ncbi:MAG: hypothetical protein WCY92_14850 [Novosphingobium sp.]|uniref:hypothetical protein n=1 Tax=Tsuneonella sp. CC-YZS046 TaxID=3042152 RepID=UPI002D7861E7|nr:hypothetical protein [Tsuneonella sp. CC-YZS046]WRO67297.1 hypothetical protein U8326_03755 [Tsuneonella sp. CC-YZS046]
MRTIEISTDVFAKIWSLRAEGEEDENTILKRLLGLNGERQQPYIVEKKGQRPGKVLWRDDVFAALQSLGGTAHLSEIYEEVRSIRRRAGRSVPINIEAIIRRELEYNSSDARAFIGKRDWFHSVDGIGGGVWSIRQSHVE